MTVPENSPTILGELMRLVPDYEEKILSGHLKRDLKMVVENMPHITGKARAAIATELGSEAALDMHIALRGVVERDAGELSKEWLDAAHDALNNPTAKKLLLSIRSLLESPDCETFVGSSLLDAVSAAMNRHLGRAADDLGDYPTLGRERS